MRFDVIFTCFDVIFTHFDDIYASCHIFDAVRTYAYKNEKDKFMLNCFRIFTANLGNPSSLSRP